jgi:hypothetical protein
MVGSIHRSFCTAISYRPRQYTQFRQLLILSVRATGCCPAGPVETWPVPEIHVYTSGTRVKQQDCKHEQKIPLPAVYVHAAGLQHCRR